MGRNAAEGFSCDVFELFSCSLPYFDRHGLILAVEGERVAGFVHAGFAPTADESGLDSRQGILSALMVHPDDRRQKIGSELVRRAEENLRSKGAESVEAGGGLNRNGFYCGIYGGLEPSGFCGSAAPWREFFGHCDYSLSSETFVLRRDLQQARDPVNAKLLRHRRHLNLVITDRPANESWWWFARFGHLDSLRFELQEKADKEVVASGQIIGMDLFIPKWGVRCVGIREVFVPESQRRHGYAQALVLTFAEVEDLNDINEFVQLLDDLVEDEFLLADDDGHTADLRVMAGADIQRVNVVATATEHASHAGEHAEFVFNENGDGMQSHEQRVQLPDGPGKGARDSI